ncbi:MAG TPA: hypothetical protein VGI08_02610 [Diaminobutyricibacter sp.]|jgi:hypothetical protein
MPGIPVGPGTVFYLVAALAMPVVSVGRRIAGRRNPDAQRLGRQVGMATGMVLTGVLSLWVFDRVGSILDGHRQPALLLLSSPLLIALVVLIFMAAISRVLRRIGR